MKIKLQTGKEVCLKDFHCTPIMLAFWLGVQQKKALKIVLKNSKKNFSGFFPDNQYFTTATPRQVIAKTGNRKAPRPLYTLVYVDFKLIFI
jgi:hypothetical protein